MARFWRKALLWLVALGYGAVGVWFFVSPELVAALGLRLHDAAGGAEVRAMYGGLQIGLGTYFLIAIRRPSWETGALRVAAFTLAGLGLCRGAGALLGAAWTPLLTGLVMLELVGAVLCGLALHGASHRDEASLSGR